MIGDWDIVPWDSLDVSGVASFLPFFQQYNLQGA